MTQSSSTNQQLMLPSPLSNLICSIVMTERSICHFNQLNVIQTGEKETITLASKLTSIKIPGKGTFWQPFEDKEDNFVGHAVEIIRSLAIGCRWS